MLPVLVYSENFKFLTENWQRDWFFSSKTIRFWIKKQIFKNIYFTELLRVTASAMNVSSLHQFVTVLSLICSFQTGVLKNTFEYNYAVRRNAKPVVFNDTVSMFSALQLSEVDIVMLDIFSLAKFKNVLDQKLLKVKGLIDTNTGFGFILSGQSNILMTDVESLLPSKSKEIKKFLEEMETKIPVSYGNISLFQNFSLF